MLGQDNLGSYLALVLPMAIAFASFSGVNE